MRIYILAKRSYGGWDTPPEYYDVMALGDRSDVVEAAEDVYLASSEQAEHLQQHLLEDDPSGYPMECFGHPRGKENFDLILIIADLGKKP